jgi:hypothetical protein
MTNALDEVVDKLGGWEALTAAEQETYKEHLKIIEGKPVTIEDTKEFMRRMITAIERELVDSTENSKESRGMKARLKNALVLEAFLYSPERAKEALERYYKKL